MIDAQKGGFHAAALGLGVLRRTGAQGEVRSGRSQIKPYFELNNVLENGVFYAANQLYGLTSRSATTFPCTSPDVRVFEVFDADGKPLALLYCDYFKRDNKNGGAWMDNFVDQSKLLGTLPVVYNVANFTKPAPGQPALISFDDVTTMFHEFGHALHGMFADTEYPSLSGTERAARFRRVSLAVQRALGALSGRLRSLREALQDRRADAGGAGGQDQEGENLQPGLRADGTAGRRRARHAVAHAAGRRAAAESGRVRKAGAGEDASRCSARAAALSLQLFLHIWGERLCGGLLRLSVDARCWTTTRSSGSRSTAA